MAWTSLAVVPLVIFVFWLYTAMVSKSFPTIQGKRILLLIAHPDDEAMFFAPTVLALTRPELQNHVKILCLSSGNAEGLGDIRKQELLKSALILGIRSNRDVLAVDDDKFPDSMTATWDARSISDLLTTTFAPKMASISSKKAPEANIDVLITFDRNGVSGHPNHKSLYEGAHTFVKTLMSRHTGWDNPVKLYTLTSVGVIRKYLSVTDAPLTMMATMLRKKEKGDAPTPLVFVSGLEAYVKGREAMVSAHKSQIVWFRWGWITLSRYMIINDLKKENPR